MAPNLFFQHEAGGQQQGADCHMNDGRTHHARQGLSRIFSPNNARQIGGKTKPKLDEQQSNQDFCWSAQGSDLAITAEYSDRGPGQDPGNENRIYEMRKNADSRVPESRAEKQLEIYRTNRQDCERASARAAFVWE